MTLVQWINVYRDRDGFIYSVTYATEEAAISMASINNCTLVTAHRIEIPYEV